MYFIRFCKQFSFHFVKLSPAVFRKLFQFTMNINIECVDNHLTINTEREYSDLLCTESFPAKLVTIQRYPLCQTFCHYLLVSPYLKAHSD